MASQSLGLKQKGKNIFSRMKSKSTGDYVTVTMESKALEELISEGKIEYDTNQKNKWAQEKKQKLSGHSENSDREDKQRLERTEQLEDELEHEIRYSDVDRFTDEEDMRKMRMENKEGSELHENYQDRKIYSDSELIRKTSQ